MIVSPESRHFNSEPDGNCSLQARIPSPIAVTDGSSGLSAGYPCILCAALGSKLKDSWRWRVALGVERG